MLLAKAQLLAAVCHGKLPVVQWLLAEGGASITERTTDGSSVLLLAEGKASITELTTDGTSALLLAVSHGCAVASCRGRVIDH